MSRHRHWHHRFWFVGRRTDLPVVPIGRRRASLWRRANHGHFFPRPVPVDRGAYRDRHERWVRDAMDERCVTDERAALGRWSRVGL